MGDLDHYNLWEDFSIREAAWLAAGHEPGLKSTPSAEALLVRMERAFFHTLREAHRQVEIGQRLKFDDACLVPRVLDPVDIESPPVRVTGAWIDLVEARWEEDQTQVRFTRSTIAAWFSANGNGFVPKYPFVQPQAGLGTAGLADKLTTTERHTLLRIVWGMATTKPYHFDPTAPRSDAATIIASSTAAAGCSVSDDTVRKYLKEAAALFGKPSSGNA